MAIEIGEMMAKIIEETTIDRIVTKGIEIRSLSQDHGRSRSRHRIDHGITQIQEIDMAMIETKSETETDPTLVTGK